MNVFRTFVAVLIDRDLRERISEVQDRIKKLAPDVKWVAPENFHITLKFLGNVREDALAGVCEAVEDAVQSSPPFDLTISGLGAFPTPRRARVVWIGTGDGLRQLEDVARAVDDNLAGLGFEREARSFKGHVTIGRIKTSRYLAELARGIEEAGVGELGIQHVNSVTVMQSELRPDGPVYSPISTAKLLQ